MGEPDHNRHDFEAENAGMTVEFLRARLLSERSVSKSAKQRADELADRVVELEEQLKVVSLQRKRAEKAASDVLAILENLGFSDYSEGYNSSSDQDKACCESINGKCVTKSTDLSRNVDQQGQESPTFSKRSLSWKSSKSASLASEPKFMSAWSRRHNSFVSTDSSSPKHRLGKSCRQVKRREIRSTVDELSNNHSLLVPQIPGNDSKLSRNSSHNEGEEVSAGDPESACLRSTNRPVNSDNHFHTHDGDREMERALEYRAELIGRYEAEENAQIEWEEKYKESNSSTPESFEHGNQSDVTEERNEWKAQLTCISPVSEEASPKVQGASLTDKTCSHVKIDAQPASPQIEKGPEKYQNEQVFNRSSDPELVNLLKKSSPIQQKLKSCSYHPSSPSVCRSAISIDFSSSLETGTEVNYCEDEISKVGPEKSSALCDGPPKDLGSVLEALKLAKWSLQHKLRKIPHSEYTLGKGIEPHYAPALMSVTTAEMSVSCAALFRVPSDFQDEPTSCKNYMDSSFKNNLRISASSSPVNDQCQFSQNGGVTRFSVPEENGFDFAPNKEHRQSSLVGRDQYARSPSIHSDSNFPGRDQLKMHPQLGAGSTFVGNDHGSQSLDLDSRFSFPTSDQSKFSSLPGNLRSSLLLDDQHGPGLFVNRLSTASSNRVSQGEPARSSLIDRNLLVKMPYNESRSGITIHSQIPGNTGTGPQSFTPEPYYNPNLNAGLPSHARYSYATPPSIPQATPQISTFGGFQSFPRSSASSADRIPDIYRNKF